MTTPNTDMLLSFHKQRSARYRLASQRLAQAELPVLTVQTMGSLNQSRRRPYGTSGRSLAFLVLVVSLALATTLFFWNQQRELEQRNAEIERQNHVASQVYHAISRYSDAPSALTDHAARVAIDSASEDGLTENRQALLSNFYRSAKRCHVGGKYGGSAQDCRKMAYNRFSAMSAALSDDLDADN
jgi:uncharacterized protein HemX